MALGSQDNNKKEVRKPSIYSPYGGTNTESKVDPSRVSFGFWNKLLKITITPMAGRTDNGIPNWDKNNEISGFLTHKKARIFANEIRKFLADPFANSNVGVISNETLISISSNEDGMNGVFLTLRKLNTETGAEMSKYVYEFNTNLHSSVRNYDAKSMNFSQEFDEYTMLEINELLTLLDSYVESMTYATAYSIIDATDFNYRRAMDYLVGCAQSLGVNISSGSGENRSSSGSSIFNQRNRQQAAPASSGRSVQHVSSEDIDDDLFG